MEHPLDRRKQPGRVSGGDGRHLPRVDLHRQGQLVVRVEGATTRGGTKVGETQQAARKHTQTHTKTYARACAYGRHITETLCEHPLPASGCAYAMQSSRMWSISSRCNLGGCVYSSAHKNVAHRSCRSRGHPTPLLPANPPRATQSGDPTSKHCNTPQLGPKCGCCRRNMTHRTDHSPNMRRD